MEETLCLDYTGSETGDECSAADMAAVGSLKVLPRDSEGERCYPVLRGENTVGRSTSCQICIPVKAISKHHATITVEKESHFIVDNSSKNHTRRNKVLLKPNTYYELNDNCDLLFGDCSCVYYTTKEQWDLFVAKRDGQEATTTTHDNLEETIPITPAATEVSSDVADVLFASVDPTNITTTTATIETRHDEQTQLLVTTEAEPVINRSESLSSSPLLTDHPDTSTQLIPLSDLSAVTEAATSETTAVSLGVAEEQTVAYQIEPADKSRSPSPMDDIDATIPYDMTQGDNLAKSPVSDSPDTDIEGTIPYEMTQGVLDDGGNKSPGGSHVDIEPTIPYEMSDTSSPLADANDNPIVAENDATVSVADPTVGVADPDPVVALDDATVAVKNDDATVAVDDATMAVDDATMAVDDATVGMADPTVAVNDQTADNDATQAIDDATQAIDDATQAIDDPAMGIANVPLMGVADPMVAVDEHDDTQSIGEQQEEDDDATLDVVVPAVDADPDHLQLTKHDETENVIASNASTNHSPTHQPAASSPTHTPMETSPPHSPKTTPIIKAASPKSPSSSTPKKVHFATTGRPSNLDVTVNDLLNDEESPDVELPSASPVLEPHPPVDNGPVGRGGARKRGRGKGRAAAASTRKGAATEKTKTTPARKRKAATETNKDEESTTESTVATTSSKGRKTTGSAKDKERSGEDSIETAPVSRRRKSTETDKDEESTTESTGATTSSKGRKTMDSAKDKEKSDGDSIETAPVSRRRKSKETNKDEKKSATVSNETAPSGKRKKSAETSKDEEKDAAPVSKRRKSAETSKDETSRNGKSDVTEKKRGGASGRGRGAYKRGGAQAGKRNSRKKQPAEPELPSANSTPIPKPIVLERNSPSFLDDDISADTLFSSGGRIKRKYTDVLLTPRRTIPVVKEEPLSVSLDDSPLGSHEPSPRGSPEPSPRGSPDPALHDLPKESHDFPKELPDILPKVLFTGVVDKRSEKVVKDLGGQLVESVYECTHLVTNDKLGRTIKLLCCLARGCPITSTKWLDKCKQQKKFVSAEPFITKDKSFEKQRKCSLSVSLARVKSGPPLLQDKQFFITPSVQPAPSDMRDIIKCAGGQVLDHMPVVASDDVSIVTCDKDIDTCKAASEGGVAIYSNEYLLSGVLRQKLEPELYRLSIKEDKKKKRKNVDSEVSSPATKRRRK